MKLLEKQEEEIRYEQAYLDMLKAKGRIDPVEYNKDMEQLKSQLSIIQQKITKDREIEK